MPPVNSTVQVPVVPLLVARDSNVACSTYVRERDYSSWPDKDKDCQITRQEVLNQENQLGKTNDCKITTGQWYDPMTDSVFTDPDALEIDHLVALAEVQRSGGALWDSATKSANANDLDLPYALNAIYGSTNSSKSDNDPVDWLPPNESYRSAYEKEWMSVKVKWGLTSDPSEMAVIRSVLGSDTVGIVFPKVKADLDCTLE